MAIWNEKFYKGKDVYSDGSIEDVILDIVRRDDYKTRKTELIGDDFVLAYHLSSIRENILNWYPFSKNESAIEIGAGCGAITGMLCRKLGKVVSVDLSKRRSTINYERHKEYDNLEIVVGNFNDMEFEEQYDYVVLNGVFEYAISFTETEKPYHDFLRHISGFLKPDGKFLIAIENKLGLKYFNGSKEDHTDNYFLGLNNYRGNDAVRTFSKKELQEILTEEGYIHTNFYYPYPDYKFPNEIFTDKSIQSNQYGRPYINIEEDRYRLFDEYAVGKTLLKEEIREIFANSFLVEASKTAFEAPVLYAKMNLERKSRFCIGTAIVEQDGNRKVVKYPIGPEAQIHIDKICDTTRLNGNKVVYLPAKKEDGGIWFEYLYEENLDALIDGYIQNKDVASITRTVKEFFDAYIEEFDEQVCTSEYNNEHFKQYFGEKCNQKEYLCIRNANIDVIMDNVYEQDGKYVLIDGEWVYPEWIPYAFIKWRAMNELYSKHTDLAACIARKDMMEQNGVSNEEEDMFMSWALHFAEEYVGSAQRGRWAKSVEDFSLDAVRAQRRAQRMVNMSLYVDCGNGFSEEEKLYQDVDIEDGSFSVVFEAGKLNGARRLRFDPVEGSMCVAQIENISDGWRVVGNNSKEAVENALLFADADPQFYIEATGETDKICIEGHMRLLHKAEMIETMKTAMEDLERYKQIAGETEQKLHECQNVVSSRETEIVNLREELEQLSATNEKNAYYANSTKAFLKRKILLKLGKIKE